VPRILKLLFIDVDFGHTWHGVGWRHEGANRRPLRLDHDVSGTAWLSFDFDYLDPALFPEVGFPVAEMGGTKADVRHVLFRITGPILGVYLLEWVPRGSSECRQIVSRILANVLEAVLA
jgi:arginase family enzyme